MDVLLVSEVVDVLLVSEVVDVLLVIIVLDVGDNVVAVTFPVVVSFNATDKDSLIEPESTVRF